MSQRYEAAMYYVTELDCSVVPIRPGEKRPAIPWKDYQREKPHQTELVEWFHQSDYQVGVVCGKVSGNLLVIDFETPQAYDEWAGRHANIANKTRTVETGKGVHVYVRLPEARPGEKLIEGLVETRGEGHQVLAPPSIHPSGRHYKLKGAAREIARVTWSEVSKGEKWENGGKRKISVQDAVETIAFGKSQGDRNDSTFNAAILLRDTGTPEVQALAILLQANDGHDPPLPRDEIKRTVESAYSKPARSGPEARSFENIKQQVTKLREEQAKGWLMASSDPDMQQLDFSARVRALFKESGTLTELQMLEVLDEVMRNPPLAPKMKTELIRIWRAASKNVRDAIAGSATDDEIALAYKAKYDNKRMFSRSRWYKWNGCGVWSDQADVVDEIWQIMVEFKTLDVNPSANKRRSIEECLRGQSFLGVHESALDAYSNRLNLLNGVYDFDTGELFPHDPQQYQTTQLPFEFDADADCPRWRQFLQEVLVAQPGETDEAMVAFMAQAFGYSLTAWVKYEMSFWLQGSGANGKSTLIHVLSALTGTASMALNLGMLERDMYQLALLPGIRVVTCTESPVGLKVADSTIKSLISGDRLSVRLPYSVPFQLDPICKIWWAMNNYPRVADTSEGFWRKVKVIPFRASFSGKRRDEDLRHKLVTELPGIFNWALDGLRSLVSDGWIHCELIEEATGAYRRSNDIEAAFIGDECVVGPDYVVSGRQLYEAYKNWCFDTGHRPKTMTRVASDWSRLGFGKRRTGSGVVYEGVGLKLETKNKTPIVF